MLKCYGRKRVGGEVSSARVLSPGLELHIVHANAAQAEFEVADGARDGGAESVGEDIGLLSGAGDRRNVRHAEASGGLRGEGDATRALMAGG